MQTKNEYGDGDLQKTFLMMGVMMLVREMESEGKSTISIEELKNIAYNLK